MANPAETVHEREQRKKHAIALSDKERLLRHKDKRRLRRQNLAPRLRYAEDGDGWQLTIPASRLTVRAMGIWSSALVASVVLTFAAFRDEVIALVLMFALVCLPIAYMFYVYLAMTLRNGLIRFHVTRDGGFSVRGRRRVLHRGTKAECAVGINYSRSNSLACLWLPGDKVIGDLGDRDVEIVRSFCGAAAVPITPKIAKGANTTAEESDADGLEDHDDYVRQKWGKRFIVIIGLSVLASVAWQELSQSRDHAQDSSHGSAKGGPAQ